MKNYWKPFGNKLIQQMLVDNSMIEAHHIKQRYFIIMIGKNNSLNNLKTHWKKVENFLRKSSLKYYLPKPFIQQKKNTNTTIKNNPFIIIYIKKVLVGKLSLTILGQLMSIKHH